MRVLIYSGPQLYIYLSVPQLLDESAVVTQAEGHTGTMLTTVYDTR